MGRVACIDVGTVTCRLAVADVQGGRVERLQRRSTICDLGENLTKTGRICGAARARVLACVDGYLAAARAAGAPSVCCTLTSAARDASNSDELLADLASRGLDAQVIPGDVEGSLTLLGVCQDFLGRLVLVADNGGGSTELALGRLGPDGLEVRAVRSVDVGCRRVTERFLSAGDPPSPTDVAAAHAFAARLLQHAAADMGLREAGAERLVVTGGTATSLVAVDAELVPYDSSYVHLRELTRPVVDALEGRLASLGLEARSALPGLQPKRAQVIVGGAIVVSELMRATGFERMTVSESDLLVGLSLTVDAVCAGDPSPVSWEPRPSMLV
ncbi:MAG: phosphatase [Acidobacteriota bacterium]|nr:phosphatase [Acidobacteriota bacterium]